MVRTVYTPDLPNLHGVVGRARKQRVQTVQRRLPVLLVEACPVSTDERECVSLGRGMLRVPITFGRDLRGIYVGARHIDSSMTETYKKRIFGSRVEYVRFAVQGARVGHLKKGIRRRLESRDEDVVGDTRSVGIGVGGGTCSLVRELRINKGQTTCRYESRAFDAV